MMTSHYAFPASRLEMEGDVDLHELPRSKIISSRYHSRTFDIDEKLRLVATLDREGGPPNLHFFAPPTAIASPS